MKTKRLLVLAKTGGRCWYCGCELVIPTREMVATKINATSWFAVDHIHPKSRGGSNELENLVPACFSCNSSKRHKSVEDFRKWSEDLARVWNGLIRANKVDVQPFEETVVFYGERCR